MLAKKAVSTNIIGPLSAIRGADRTEVRAEISSRVSLESSVGEAESMGEGAEEFFSVGELCFGPRLLLSSGGSIVDIEYN